MSLLYPVMLAVIVVIAYGNILQSPFVLDDLHNIVQNQYIRIQSLDVDALQTILSPFNPTRQRPVASLSFALNYLAGGYDPVGYHLVNICIHLAAALVVFRLYCWYLRRGGGKDDAAVPGLGLATAAALIWAANPVQTSAVTYIVQRMTSLSALFFLLSLLLYLHARDLIAAHGFRARPGRSGGLLLTALLFWLLALLTKENAAILPAIVFLHEVYFFDNLSWEKVRARKYLYLSVLLFFLMLGGTILATGLWRQTMAGYAERDFTMTERLLTQARVVIHYLSLFLWPLPSRLTLFYDFPFSRSLLAPISTLFSLLALATMIGSSCLLARRYPLVTFGLFWALLCLLIESTVIPLEMVFEHRFYLPSVGFALAATVGLTSVLHRLPGRRQVAVPVLVGLGVVFALMTHTRNQDWRSEVSLHADGVRKAPGLARVANGLAVAYIREGRQQEALAELQRALSIDPVNVVTLANMFLVVSERGRTAAAESILARLQQAVAAGHFHCKEVFNLSMVVQFLQKQMRCEPALVFLAAMGRCESVSANPLYHYNRGRCAAEIGDYRQARASFAQALALDGRNPHILFSLARASYLSGDHAQAEQTLRRLRQVGVPAELAPLVAEMEGILRLELFPGRKP